LGNGTNIITLHATDLAGNTANVSLMLDYVPNTNSPGLNVIWPPDGTQISGGSFTVQAQTDDNTSTVMAVITDSSGNTNTVSGMVEQNGTLWVRNLPLAAGANQLTLTVANASGSSTTNLTVYQSSVLVTVAPLTADQLNQASITVRARSVSWETRYSQWRGGERGREGDLGGGRCAGERLWDGDN